MDFTQWSKKELQKYNEFILNQYRRIDGFWFLGVENKFGYQSAIELNDQVWNRMSKLITREIKERFSIQQKGLGGFVKVLKYFPWAIITGYQIEVKDHEVFISVPHCPSQEARLKRGIGEYDCKNMHYGEFEGIINQVDENIKIECLFAPPDDHPKELFCNWRFTMKA